MTRGNRRRAVALLLCTALAGCSNDSPPPETSSPAPAQANETAEAPPVGAPVGLDTVASGLEVPWSLDFAHDGRIFLTERVGRIRVIEKDALQPEAWAELAVFAQDEQLKPESGLMGIALAPDFATSGHVYVMGTFRKGAASGLPGAIDKIFRKTAGIFSDRAAIPFENRVYRLTDRGGRGVEPTLIIDDLPANYYHAGGALAFGPDGMLYVGIGEALASMFESGTDRGSGKILRYKPDGSIPADNPTPGSPVFVTGLRNPQALAWDSETGVLVSTEHGPSFLPHERGRAGKDELNVVLPGSNYGWPAVAGISSDSGYTNPIREWSPAIAPGGVAFYMGPHTAWRGNAFVGGLRGQQLRRIVFDSAVRTGRNLRIAREELLLFQSIGRVRAVRMGRDGHLWITTSNRDGRGQPGALDDLVLRVIPNDSGRVTATR